MPNVFYARCRPWGTDAIQIALDNNIVFFGYPIIDRTNYNGANLQSCMVSPAAPDEEWADALDRFGIDSRYRGQANRARNIVRESQPEDILLVPRPDRGVIYAGTVQSFELINNPAWAAAFRQLLQPNASPEFHETEVAQCWRVDQLVPIPYPRIPAWIKASLFGRSMMGRVRPVMEQAPHAAITAIINNPTQIPAWTIEMREVELRLTQYVGPSSLEHLVVALLQLEYPNEQWVHVGGSGDGGVDGIGSNESGEVTGLLQCKWRYANEELPFNVHPDGFAVPRRIVASLHHLDPVLPEGVEFLGRRRIAELVVAHADHLPLATTMRVGHHDLSYSRTWAMPATL